MSERDDYYLSELKKIDGHIEMAERLLARSELCSSQEQAMVNAMLAEVLALVEIGKVLGEIRDEVKKNIGG